MKEDIEKYLKGQLGPEEMHALEMKALSDPFLFDALGGAESIGAKDFLAAVQDLDHRIAGKQKRKYPPATLWRIAASVALLVGASYTIYTFLQPKDSDTLAQEISEEEAKESSAPSATATDSTQEESKEKLLSLNRAVAPQPEGEAPGGAKEETKPFSEPVTPLSVPTEQAESQAASGAIAKPADDLDKSAVDQIATTESREKIAAEQGPSDRKKDIDGAPGELSKHVIKGKVTDTGGSPIPGANVIVQGTAQGTVSDVNGNFQLITDSPRDQLVISFIGYQIKEVKIPSDPSQVNVQLQADVSSLSEVVVTGYAAGAGESVADEPMELASPADGRRAYNKYLESSLKYPPQAIEKKIEGRVTLEFAVQADGTLSDFSIVRGLESGCNEEVIRLVTEGPRWKPSSRAGTPVKSTVRVSVKFKLPE